MVLLPFFLEIPQEKVKSFIGKLSSSQTLMSTSNDES